MNDTKNKFKNKVKFNLQKNIKTFQDVDRRLSMTYYRGLITKCSDSHNKIFSILNFFTNNSFLPLNFLDSDKEDPVHIVNPDICWDDDDSPYKLLEYWKNKPYALFNHLNIINNELHLLCKNDNKIFGKNLEINLPIKNNLYKLNTKVSGNFTKKIDEITIYKIKNIDFILKKMKNGIYNYED